MSKENNRRTLPLGDTRTVELIEKDGSALGSISRHNRRPTANRTLEINHAPEFKKTNSDHMLFLKKFIKAPLQVGSLIPSSRYLVRKIVSKKEIEGCSTLVELGMGTGRLTELILEYKKEATQVLLFEKDLSFVDYVDQRFGVKKSNTISIHHDAFELNNILKSRNDCKPELILCSLPFSNFPEANRLQLIRQIYDALPTGGVFVAYQYSRLILPELKKLYRSVETSWVLLNVPPATVYRCVK